MLKYFFPKLVLFWKIVLNSFPCNTFIITEWRITALGTKEIRTVKFAFQIMGFFKETEKVLDKIHNEHQFLSLTSTIFGGEKKVKLTNSKGDFSCQSEFAPSLYPLNWLLVQL